MIKIVVSLLSMSMFLFPIHSSSISVQINTKKILSSCNLYEGEWVLDEAYPLFNSSLCPFIRSEFNCMRYGRPDQQYLKYRWQPSGCDLPRFDANEFLKQMKGKKIMFIGDSISSNQGTSLICLLYVATWGLNVTRVNASPISSVTFQDYDVTVSVFLSHYLVDIENRGNVTVLNLNSLNNGDLWKEQDVLIFNSWLWWGRKTFDFFENDGELLNNMNSMEAFRKALTTWANWVNTTANPGKNRVFFQGISPMHYNGAEWNEPGATNCANETTPLSGSTYPSGEPLALTVVKQVLSNISSSKHVELLDITKLSQLRKDGHPSSYSGLGGMDCTHWCVAGVMEAWNELLYAQLFQETLSIDFKHGH